MPQGALRLGLISCNCIVFLNTKYVENEKQISLTVYAKFQFWYRLAQQPQAPQLLSFGGDCCTGRVWRTRRVWCPISDAESW